MIQHMRGLRGYVLLLIIALAWCVALSGSEGDSNGINSILHRFPGYHLLTLQERDSETSTYFVRHFPKDNPSVVHADFDGDGHPDYAILLKDNKSGTGKLVVLFCPLDAQCTSVYELDITSSSGEVYIRPVPIGSRVSQTDAIDTKDYPSPARLRSHGIEVTYFGQAKVVYYWNRKHKKMEAVQTED
jgi:hypothetical protein